MNDMFGLAWTRRMKRQVEQSEEELSVGESYHSWAHTLMSRTDVN